MLELTAPFNEKGKVTHTLKLQRKLKFGSTSCTTEEKRREKERKHPWRFKGKTSTRAFLTQLTHKLSKGGCSATTCELRELRGALLRAQSSFSRPLRGLATKDLVLRLAQEVSRASPAGSAAAGASEFCPSLRALKTSLFGKSGKRFQKLLNGCRREASFLTTCIINSATNCMILLKFD